MVDNRSVQALQHLTGVPSSCLTNFVAVHVPWSEQVRSGTLTTPVQVWHGSVSPVGRPSREQGCRGSGGCGRGAGRASGGAPVIRASRSGGAFSSEPVRGSRHFFWNDRT